MDHLGAPPFMETPTWRCFIKEPLGWVCLYVLVVVECGSLQDQIVTEVLLLLSSEFDEFPINTSYQYSIL